MSDQEFEASPIPMAWHTFLVSNRTGREDECRILNTAAIMDMIGFNNADENRIGREIAPQH